MPETAIRERPILFSGPMVRAILSGVKTMTRRAMKPQPPKWCTEFGFTAFTPPGSISGRGYWKGVPGEEGPGEKFFRCPYGARLQKLCGSRLWVREAWSPWADEETRLAVRDERPCVYRADYRDGALSVEMGGDYKWRPSIHMPRSASRLTLEITAVRVERIQDITLGDCHAEGFPYGPDDKGAYLGSDRRLPLFRAAWDAMNGKRGFGWNENPWVWVLEFKMIEVKP